MSFTFPAGARAYFDVGGGRPFSKTEANAVRFNMFDAFSCCLLLGLDRRRPAEDEDRLEPTNFLPASGYPETHRSQAVMYAGLLVDAELARKDIAPEDRASIEQVMITLLDLTSPTRLSAEGNKLLSQYAASGFERLRSAVPTPPNLEDFLVDYAELWKSIADPAATS